MIHWFQSRGGHAVRNQKTLWLSLGLAGGIVAAGVWEWRRRARRNGAGESELTGDRSRYAQWRFDRPFRTLPGGKLLRIEVTSPAMIHWTVDQWDTAHDTRTRRLGPSLYAAELPTDTLELNTRVQFTFFWPEVNRWECEDFEVRVEEAAAGAG